jgi:hypothetical protein
MIAAHLRAALRRIEAGGFTGAQVNVCYAEARLRDAVGTPPFVLDAKEGEALANG